MASKQDFEIVTNKTAKSPVWEHFGFIKIKGSVDKKQVGCRLCNMIFKYSGNTTNLRDHLTRKHPTATCKSQVDSSSAATTCAINNSATSTQSSSQQAGSIRGYFGASLPITKMRAKTITSAVTRFIVKDLRPFSVVQNSGFRNLIHVLEPKYTLPTRQTFSDKMIPELYSTVKEEVLQDLKGSYVALTTDGWTSRRTQSYVTITSSHVNDQWQIKNYVLQTRAMPVAHTGINIAAVLTDAVHEWGLQPSPPIVSDNAANMLVAAKAFGTTFHVGCFAHTLNLACVKAMKLDPVAQLLSKLRGTVAYFHRSSTATHILSEKQTLLQIPSHKLVMDVSTRWNSSLDMINRYIEQQPAVYAALTCKELRGKCSATTLSEDDLTTAEDLALILTPLKTATVALCEEAVPTVSMILPLQYQLQRFMTPGNKDVELIANVKEVVRSNLATRYTDPRVRKNLILAALLDPRFKAMPFLSDDEKLEAYHDLTVQAVASASTARKAEVVKAEPGEEPNTPELPTMPQLEEVVAHPSPCKKSKQEIEVVETKVTKPTAMSSLFGDVYVTHVQLPKSPQELCELEVGEYRKEQPIGAMENPLVWWNGHNYKYKNLSVLAKKYLCIPATSVPSERVFSTAGDIVTAQRSALKSEFVDMLIFLKKNWNPTD